jgi:hypothetical protein
MRISSAFPSKYLKAADLDGRTVTVTMDRVVMEDIGAGNGDQKPVLYFQGTNKGLVLNVTNGNIIAEKFGDETNSWKGEKIILYEAMVEFKGKMGPAIRVRHLPNSNRSAPFEVQTPVPFEDPNPDDPIPF